MPAPIGARLGAAARIAVVDEAVLIALALPLAVFAALALGALLSLAVALVAIALAAAAVLAAAELAVALAPSAAAAVAARSRPCRTRGLLRGPSLSSRALGFRLRPRDECACLPYVMALVPEGRRLLDVVD
eukprot:15217336-Heterocapsa_arctica.AAC.1